MHDADFRQSERDWHSFVGALTERLMGIDDTIPELPVKDVVSPASRVCCTMHELLTYHIPSNIRFSAFIGILGSPPIKLPTRYAGRGKRTAPPTHNARTNARFCGSRISLLHGVYDLRGIILTRITKVMNTGPGQEERDHMLLITFRLLRMATAS